MANNKPLSDILVVALEQAVAAPYCSSRLADAGARVIKIERKEGEILDALRNSQVPDVFVYVGGDKAKKNCC